ncbi:hypothetical protein PPACK8108_LOCUS1153 [Phakopsora pachyrhizi]|uniref:Uncharacterized protein n=1 Tax=Phakopsora pachyrhizi TaxID=170000 RepID=A0AAV0AHL4_PHAPC|nr:hypothetical protein PPACK8108_LOCUS1153 [Phakopsora pachyrhizi]
MYWYRVALVITLKGQVNLGQWVAYLADLAVVAGLAGWLKMPLFEYAIANHPRRPLYYFSLDFVHTYVPTNCSYSSYPPFNVAFVDTNHYVVLHFKKINGSIPAPPIDGWWFRKSSSRNKNLWLQSLQNYLMIQKLMPSASGGAVINLD